jgi:hypothetical protein
LVYHPNTLLVDQHPNTCASSVPRPSATTTNSQLHPPTNRSAPYDCTCLLTRSLAFPLRPLVHPLLIPSPPPSHLCCCRSSVRVCQPLRRLSTNASSLADSTPHTSLNPSTSSPTYVLLALSTTRSICCCCCCCCNSIASDAVCFSSCVRITCCLPARATTLCAFIPQQLLFSSHSFSAIHLLSLLLVLVVVAAATTTATVCYQTSRLFAAQSTTINLPLFVRDSIMCCISHC